MYSTEEAFFQPSEVDYSILDFVKHINSTLSSEESIHEVIPVHSLLTGNLNRLAYVLQIFGLKLPLRSERLELSFNRG